MTPALILAIVSAVLTGCAKPADNAGTTVPALPAGDVLVIRVEYVDGFLPIEVSASQLPVISVYADGRVLTQGPQLAIYPGPALPAVEQRLISRDDVARLAGLVLAAGVGTEQDFGQPMVMDAPDTQFIVHTADRSYRTRVNALGSEQGSDLTRPQLQARQKLRDLSKALSDLPATLGSSAVGASQPYQATEVVAFTSPYVATVDVPTPPSAVWPGPELPGTSWGRGPDLGCLTVTGDQARSVLDAAGRANSAVGWISAAKTWKVTFRPLLPDERDCDGLKPGA